MPTWTIFVLVVIAVLVIGKFLFALSILSVFPITRGAMFHPSAPVRVKAFLDAVPMKAGELLIDIGCGDGRILREARRRYGVRALGFEVNPLAYVLARMKNVGASGIEVRCQNFWKTEITEADVVFCYLFPDVMAPLAEKLTRELRPGTRVVSGNFTIPNWKHQQILYPASSLHGDPLYLYQFPEAVNVTPPQGE